ncbi:hypothetical protein [Acetivibrio clariflavus]|uniref:Uncharacterized protein n=1 Tax=Acetivibrio clariflavus (strain DSM 19732 / NBRC 101661 / EBR45) TaxID=720554 RepID=G8LUS3_ACECE|nr:hypothetical protein [Acetivibrio clariflavus]AEV67413.1 hypothetical protein Clocl_0709 [Acetivibrio clariflavus DSM 19732]
MNKIYLRRKNKIIINTGLASTPNTREVATILKNIESLGYTFFKKLVTIVLPGILTIKLHQQV